MTNPICFISYSWDSEAHKDWVRTLATELMNNGVNVRLDQWDARPGIDLGHFMEENIRSANFVLLVCTPNFASKANNATGGVGYEKAIITGELFHSSPDQGKFVPILRDGDTRTSLPSYLLSKLYIDFRESALFGDSFETLLRHIFNSPKYKRPPLGSAPDFSDEKSLTTKVEKTSPLPSFKSGNTAYYVNPKRWDWTVFITGDERDLEKVDYVEYTLHETFSNPVRVIRDRGKGKEAFPLSTNGWGTFRIFIRVFLKDGNILSLSHDLKFS